MKRILVALAGTALLVSVTAASSATRATSAPAASGMTSRVEVVIKHAYLGCHVWSANGNRAAATQEVTLGQGGLLTVTNLDNCKHTLVQVSGPAPTWMGALATGKQSDGTLTYGAPVTLELTTPGTYEFGTFEGPHGLTIQERAGDAALAPDNDLLLKVTVVPHGIYGGLPTSGHAAID
jgi:hypothetical protein